MVDDKYCIRWLKDSNGELIVYYNNYFKDINAIYRQLAWLLEKYPKSDAIVEEVKATDEEC